MTHWKRPWCWERLKAVGEGDDREWDGWMASPTRWTWVWASPGSWWWTGKSGVLQSMGSQRVRQDWATELNCVSSWAHLILIFFQKLCPAPFPPISKVQSRKNKTHGNMLIAWIICCDLLGFKWRMQKKRREKSQPRTMFYVCKAFYTWYWKWKC